MAIASGDQGRGLLLLPPIFESPHQLEEGRGSLAKGQTAQVPLQAGPFAFGLRQIGFRDEAAQVRTPSVPTSVHAFNYV
jgi:hypothetical protein